MNTFLSDNNAAIADVRAQVKTMSDEALEQTYHLLVFAEGTGDSTSFVKWAVVHELNNRACGIEDA